MVVKDAKRRKAYQYPIVSLFGPRSLNQDVSLDSYYNNTQSNLSQYNSPNEQLENRRNESISFSRTRFERQADLEGTASGYGDYYCPEGIPIETALFCLLGAFGLAFGALFRAITLITGGRKKRSTVEDTESSLSILDLISDLIWSGRLMILVTCILHIIHGIQNHWTNIAVFPAHGNFYHIIFYVKQHSK